MQTGITQEILKLIYFEKTDACGNLFKLLLLKLNSCFRNGGGGGGEKKIIFCNGFSHKFCVICSFACKKYFSAG